MSNLTDKDVEAIAGGCLAILIIPALFAVRSAVIGFCLWYVMPFWLTYLHSPNHWTPWYGFAMGAVPIFAKTVNRLAILGTIGTFFASFFLG